MYYSEMNLAIINLECPLVLQGVRVILAYQESYFGLGMKSVWTHLCTFIYSKMQ